MLLENLLNVIIYCGFLGTAITSMDYDSSVIMTVRHNNRKYQQQQKGLKTATIESSETILNENLLTNRNSYKKNNINKYDNIISTKNNFSINNNNNSNSNSKINSSSDSSNKRITIMSMPQKIIKIISIVTGSSGRGISITNGTTNKVLKKDYNNNDGKRKIYDNRGNDEYGDGGGSDSNIIIRGTRDVTNSDMDEIGWTNINEEVDLTIPLVFSHLQELGMTDFKLPDMEETISLKPLFITYSAGLLLHNGSFYNIEGISRNGDAMMTYHDKAFQFRLNLIIRKLQFDYDFTVKIMHLSATGTVVGTLEDLLITGDFSVDIRDPIIQLNDFQIVKFGNIIVQLNHNRIVQELSGIILTPITNLFRDRITAGITDDMKHQLSEIIAEFSRKDQLGIKKFMSQILSSITRQNNE